jgi:integrase
MACIVKERNGRLAYRLFWDGYRSWEGTGVRATDKRRETMQKKADVMTQEMNEGRFDYLQWFPNGAKAHLFKQAAVLKAPPKTLALYVEGTWLPRKVPPNVRRWLEVTYRKHWRKHIKPAFGSWALTATTTAALEDFKVKLTAVEPQGKGLKVKTARDIIDGTFRAIIQDARRVDHFVTADPFADPTWPRKVVPKPDPFTADERDQLLDFFWRRKRHYFAFVYVLFFTGLRTPKPSGCDGARWTCGVVGPASTCPGRSGRTTPRRRTAASARSRSGPKWSPCYAIAGRFGCMKMASSSSLSGARR